MVEGYFGCVAKNPLLFLTLFKNKNKIYIRIAKKSGHLTTSINSSYFRKYLGARKKHTLL